jgi:hypothetical protein
VPLLLAAPIVMKFKLSLPELAYLHHNVNQIIAHVPRKLVDAEVLRTFGKMKWKFAPSSLWVNLGKKERTIVAEMLTYRLDSLNRQGMPSEERDLVAELLRKIINEAPQVDARES